MKQPYSIAFMIVMIMVSSFAFSQTINLSKDNVKPVGVTVSFDRGKSKTVLQVVKDSIIKDIDEATFAKLSGIEFTDGTIEVNVLSTLTPNASEGARGFIGVAFRINEDNSKFECFYIRPTNGRAEDQVRRNHSIQYFAYPDFKFPRLRKEFPEKYESYADMGWNEWIRIKIVVKGNQAKLFLNGNVQPSLIVNDLKLEANQTGSIGLFVDVGTQGQFAELKITK